MNPTDFLGREIRPGDLIVYPWRRGSQMGLNKMIAMQVTTKNIGGYSGLGNPVRVRNMKNIVVVERRRPSRRTDVPLYDLECSACGYSFEEFQAMDQAAHALREVRPEESPPGAVEALCDLQQLLADAPAQESRHRHRPEKDVKRSEAHGIRRVKKRGQDRRPPELGSPTTATGFSGGVRSTVSACPPGSKRR